MISMDKTKFDSVYIIIDRIENNAESKIELILV